MLGESNFNVIILAGGLGTRLRSVVGDVPKPIAPIDEKPFLYYLLKNLQQFNVKEVVLSLCYEPEKVKEALKPYHFEFNLDFITEPTALGTGGGILYCLNEKEFDDVLVLNGDTFFDIDLNTFFKEFKDLNSDVHIASRIVEDSGRYGSLTVSNDKIVAFNEKGIDGQGLINGGIYALKTSVFKDIKPGEIFSFENFLKESVDKLLITTKQYDSPFIDIGIPEDYKRASNFLRDIP
ncbi:MAG: nucleotidyltransferase family protein [Proteobacteria bacterium]|nr:nucleotidyltransferase family protein [Pseudomonadota bacterium]